jgi:phage-related minor tail protein
MSLDIGKLVGYLELDDSKFGKILDKMPERLRGAMGAGMAASALVGAAVGGALIAGIGEAMDMEKANAKLSAQLNLTSEESARMGKAAGVLFADNYGEGIEDVNSAIDAVISSIDGMKDANESTVVDITGKLMSMSTAYEVEVGRMAQVVGQLISTGLAEDAEEGADLVAAAMARVPQSVREDVLDAADEYGPFFAQLGIDGTTAFGLLTQASEKGMYGIDKTGDALKEFTIRATDMSAASKVGYDALGMSQEEMTRKILAGGDSASGAFADIIHGLQDIEDPAAQSQAALALFGTPLEDLGTSEIPNFLGQMDPMGDAFDDVTGAAGRLDDKLNSGSSNSWDALLRSGQAVAAQFGTELLPILQAVMDWIAANPGTVKALAVVVLVLAAAFGVLAAALWVASLTPITLIIAAIVLAVGLLIAGIILLVSNWDAIWGKMVSGWEGFVGWITGAFDGFLAWWGGVWDGFTGFLGDALDWVIDAFMNFTPLGLLISNFEEIITWFSELPGKILDGIVTGWEIVSAWFASLPETILGFLTAAGEWLLDTGYNLLVGLLAGILVGLYLIGEFFLSLPATIVGWLTTIGLWLVTTGTALITGLRDGIVAGWTAVVEWFTALPANIAAFVLTMSTWLLVHGTNLINGLRDGIVAGYTTVIAWFQALPANIAAFVVGMGTWLIVHGTNLLNGLQQGVVSGYTTVSAWFASLPGKITGFVVGFAVLLVTKGRELLTGMQSGVTSGYTAVSAWFSSLPSKITSALGNFGSLLTSSGKNLIDGLLQGITGAAGKVFEKIGQLAADVKDRFANILDIHSPSRVFRGFGRNIGEGLLLGLEDIQPDVSVGVARMADLRVDSPQTAAASPRGPLVDARVTVNGNVGWSKDDVEKDQNARMNQSLSLAGVDDLSTVS